MSARMSVSFTSASSGCCAGDFGSASLVQPGDGRHGLEQLAVGAGLHEVAMGDLGGDRVGPHEDVHAVVAVPQSA